MTEMPQYLSLSFNFYLSSFDKILFCELSLHALYIPYFTAHSALSGLNILNFFLLLTQMANTDFKFNKFVVLYNSFVKNYKFYAHD